ncbi:MAG: peptidoglycan DD-metalloendopeptidase family protein [Bacteroidia bacterium]
MRKHLPLVFITSIVISIMLSFSACTYPTNSASDVQAVSLSSSPIPAPPVSNPANKIYGIDVNDYKVMQGEVQRNEVLGELLADHGVPYPKVIAMVDAAKGIFDIRKMRSGKPYTFIQEESGAVDYFVYEKNKTEYIVWDLRDSVLAYGARKPIKTEEREASGIITSSLYGAIQKQGIDISLASELENIYGWTLDFFHTQKGDWFKVVFDEAFVDGESIGIAKVKSVAFKHGDQTFYAIGFEKEGKLEYFDENGNSMRKAFLKAPLNYTRISSGFTYRRFHPILKRSRPHLGIDYAAPTGTPIRSIGDGTIIKATYAKGNGRFIKVRHNSTYATQYLHMSRFAEGMRVGKVVKQGDVIGFVGSTGLATGPHLCFRFWQNGRQVNPASIQAPPVEPIPEDIKPMFLAVKDVVVHRLDNIVLPLIEAEPAPVEAPQVEEGIASGSSEANTKGK